MAKNEEKLTTHAVILAGGRGTRFWPRSRQKKPKQFLSLVGERTLLQQTLDRIEALAPAEKSWVITSAAHRDECAKQLPELPETFTQAETQDGARPVPLEKAPQTRRDGLIQFARIRTESRPAGADAVPVQVRPTRAWHWRERHRRS